MVYLQNWGYKKNGQLATRIKTLYEALTKAIQENNRLSEVSIRE